jgi:hypothetical protein
LKELYSTIFALTLIAYSINAFFVFIGDTLGISQLTALAIPQSDIDSTVETSTEFINSTQSGGFNVALIFGDWVKPINTFIALISLQGLVNIITGVMGAFGGTVTQTFIIALSSIFAIIAIAALTYLISGRQ